MLTYQQGVELAEELEAYFWTEPEDMRDERYEKVAATIVKMVARKLETE